MILTVNANAAIDRVLFLDDLTPRGTVRAERSLECVGGKGADTALALNRLGAPHRMVGFNAGAYGRILEGLYQRSGIQSRPIWVEGETRTVTVIIERATRQMTQISHPGYRVSAQDCARLLQAVEEEAAGAGWCVAAGSLPPGAPVDFFRQVGAAAHRAGARLLLDASGPALTAALDARPDLVKLNHDEFSATFGGAGDSPEQIAARAIELIRQHAVGAFVVTLGERGILLARPGACWLARAPRLDPVNPAGAGDAASAALVYRLSLGDPDGEALRWACACGAAAVLSEATADFSLDMARAILANVDARPVLLSEQF